MDDKIKITGLKEVRRALRDLPKEVRKRELSKALRKGARLIQAAAIQRAAVGVSYTRKLRGKEWVHTAGTLKRGIVIRAEKKRFLRDAAKLRIGVLVDNRKVDTPWYWRMVEFGTSKKSARPFLTPAFEATKIIANDAIILALKKSINRLVKLKALKQ